jgi:dTDP-N-acetylfucosamine:lipid II N-acetylfucosaminyltransferase
MNIVHIAPATVFLPPFIEMMSSKRFIQNKHIFFLDEALSSKEISEKDNVLIFNKGRLKNIILFTSLIIKISKADKIIFHGFFNPKIILTIFFMPWIFNKCYWIIWGADLYDFKYGNGWKNKLIYFFVSRVVKRIGHIVTYIKGDYNYAVKWFGTKAKYHECLMYQSNIFKEIIVPPKFNTMINILVGNSADPANNHRDIFFKLKNIKYKNVKIYVPLSYGDKKYAEKIIKIGNKQFGEKIEFITDFMPLNKYQELLAMMDIAIFNHPYQQAMGNIITLLGLGKKVFMRSDVTQWELFKNHGIEVYDINQFNVIDMDEIQVKENIERVKSYFSETTYINQISEILN